MKTKKGRPAIITGIDSSKLENWLKEDNIKWAAIKCQALISINKGISVTDVCKVLNVTRESIRLWRNIVQTKGHEKLISNSKKGRKSKLTPELKKQLKKILSKSPYKLEYKRRIWSGKLICDYLRDKHKINISVRTAQNWINQIGIRKEKRKRITFR